VGIRIRLYTVQANVIFQNAEGYMVSRQLPTFYLTSEEARNYIDAERQAERLLRDANPDFEGAKIEYFSISTSFTDYEPVVYGK
jgi:hypothetical protein